MKEMTTPPYTTIQLFNIYNKHHYTHIQRIPSHSIIQGLQYRLTICV